MKIFDKIKEVANEAGLPVKKIETIINIIRDDVPGPSSETDKKNSTKRESSRYIENAHIKKMYDSQLDQLIEIALMDGILTEKKRQILIRKAQSLEIDVDEFEMVLEAREYEKQCSIIESENNSF
jgi:hypothetical protein